MSQFSSWEQRSNYLFLFVCLFVCLEVWKFGIDEFKINMETLNPNNYTFSFISTFKVLCSLNIWCGSHIVASITGQNGNCGFKNKDMFRHN